jgi:hypothetical protein
LRTGGFAGAHNLIPQHRDGAALGFSWLCNVREVVRKMLGKLVALRRVLC